MEIQWNKNLEKLRDHWGKTQKTMGEIFGLEQNEYQRIEKNAKFPLPEICVKLQEKGVNLNWLITGKGNMFEKTDKGIDARGTNSKLDVEAENSVATLKQMIVDLREHNRSLVKRVEHLEKIELQMIQALMPKSKEEENKDKDSPFQGPSKNTTNPTHQKTVHKSSESA